MIAISKVFFRCFLGFIAVLIFFKKSFDPKFFLQSLALPFRHMSSEITQFSKALLFEAQSKETLINFCKELADENASLNFQLQQNFDQRNKLTALENLVQIGKQLSHDKIFARIIARDISAWYESIMLNKGREQGVKENAIVLSNCGIIGKVSKVFENFSTVTLTSSPKFRLAVCFENFPMPMIFSGNGSVYTDNKSKKYELKAMGTLKNVPIDAESLLSRGTRVIACVPNGLEGLTLGHIENIYPTVDGMFLTADVLLPEGLNNVQEVIILIPDDL